MPRDLSINITAYIHDTWRDGDIEYSVVSLYLNGLEGEWLETSLLWVDHRE